MAPSDSSAPLAAPTAASGRATGSTGATLLAGVLIGVVLATSGFALYAASRGGAGVASHRTLRLAHNMDREHPVHLGMERLAELVAQRSGGELQIVIYPNAQLGEESQYLEQLQAGTLDMAKVSASPLESFVPEAAVFSLPYVFRSRAHYWTALDGEVGEDLLRAGVERGLRGLCYYDAGSRSFYTRSTPLSSPADLRNLKIRVQKSRTAMDMITAMGGSPTPVPWGELYTALQQGMVDGAENNPVSYLAVRHFEVAPYFSLNEHARVPDIILMGETTWQTLSPAHQQILREAAQASSRHQRELWAARTDEALAELAANGVTIHHPDQASFVEAVEPMLQRYEGTAVGGYVDRILDVAERMDASTRAATGEGASP